MDGTIRYSAYNPGSLRLSKQARPLCIIQERLPRLGAGVSIVLQDHWVNLPSLSKDWQHQDTLPNWKHLHLCLLMLYQCEEDKIVVVSEL